MSFGQRLHPSVPCLIVVLSGVGCRDLLGVDDLTFDENLSHGDAAPASAPTVPSDVEASDGGPGSPADVPSGGPRDSATPGEGHSTSSGQNTSISDADAGSPSSVSPTAPVTTASSPPTFPPTETEHPLDVPTDTEAPTATTPSMPAPSSPEVATGNGGSVGHMGAGGAAGSSATDSAGGRDSTDTGGSTTAGGATSSGGTTSSGGSSGAAGSTPETEPDAGADPGCSLDVTSLDEDFSNAARFEDELAQGCWATFHATRLGYADVDESDSVFRALPNANTGWYQATTGPLYYRATTGNFVIESDVTTSLPTDAAAPPGERWSGGALLVYDPASTLGVDDVYYLIGTGRLEGSNTGIKSETTDSPQTLQQLDMALGHSNRLRICRLGATVYTLYAPLGSDDWSFFTYDTSTSLMPDLPERVYVGFSAFQYQPGGANVTQVEFDHVRLSTSVQSFSDCTAPLP